MLCVSDLGVEPLTALLDQYSLELKSVDDGAEIPGSFWGEPEAGIVGRTVFARPDTPIHSLLHEMAHIICMDDDRRRRLHRDAGADDVEEEAVCYLQVLLADALPGVGSTRLMQDMDSWGYSFRVGQTADWFESDSKRAADWLRDKALIDAEARPTFQLRV